MANIEGEKMYGKEFIFILMSTMPYDKSFNNKLYKKPEMILEQTASKGAVDTLDQLFNTYTVYSPLSVLGLSGLRITRSHSGLAKKFKEKHFHTYHACKIDVDVRSRDSFREP
ncbi:hypothetical protein AVEN_248517-1 [Araneus ventricosus]|uniref:PiggyBac transposable element-derived protein domain-containing protein n=1 Tax=Araneus ventricosus TaxID=182803 RepID=A0A4Y2E065_ARAVE|nr:hypothetical protein AVEN_248517-1 [Araneus ventricosus]